MEFDKAELTHMYLAIQARKSLMHTNYFHCAEPGSKEKWQELKILEKKLLKMIE